MALDNRVEVNNVLNAPDWVVKKLPPKNLKKSALINGINEYHKYPPNNKLKLVASINIMQEIEIAEVYERNIVDIDKAITV